MQEESDQAGPIGDKAAGDGEAGDRQQLLLVTGMLGAGKTTALRVLEDLGWEIIDNFPVRLLDRLIETPDAKDGGPRGPLAIGFDSRTRGFDPHRIIKRVKQLSERGDLQITTLFLDCASRELERRYNETRRRHPLAAGTPAATGIRAERELLAPLRRWADMLIDTTEYSTNDLQKVIREKFASSVGEELTITVSSFGFSRGMPPVADLVFDMRFLDNPHWNPVLRPLTGLDAPVGEHIRADPAFAEAFTRIRDLVLFLLPRYREQGKAYVHIAFGCTGGRHRSVFMAEQIAAALRDSGFSPTLLHRNLGSRAADLPEGGLHREK
ncbi:RNase adapter RapZ [Novosphingobium album (ex Liu et al. 2023)]|uniref:RNase adapter RapZ n=1 Tax=Novosphingobium album (ex Liu et al. 2023) TaxID=3031130 RepID=A0ABT5WPK0_9SPHN|nr:RNase adapter RapZ [Novosphingobium album (ex Liu et al. 2023)]MDE8651948.1 RNase adapter RapZ [Novosphingobium album (ex Liu et al. 2023)]